MITALSAAISECEFGSWCLLTFILSVDYTLPDQIIKAGIYLGLAIILISIGVGISFNIAIYNLYYSDRGLQTWK